MKALIDKKKAVRIFSGTWHNQHNSEMELSASDDGTVKGVFKTAGDEDSPTGHAFPLTGLISNDVIAFCVSFENHGSATAWVGQITGHSEIVLETMWHMSLDVGRKSQNCLWKSVISGADRFVKGPRPCVENQLKSAASHPMWTYPQAWLYPPADYCEQAARIEKNQNT